MALITVLKNQFGLTLGNILDKKRVGFEKLNQNISDDETNVTKSMLLKT